MTRYINIDKSNSPCHSTNHQMPDKCVLEKLTEDLGCNLPWNPIANGNTYQFLFLNANKN